MAQNKLQPCKLCGTPTIIVFNIDFKAVPVCDGCADAITMQQVTDYTKKRMSAEKQNRILNLAQKMLMNERKRLDIRFVRIVENHAVYFRLKEKTYVIFRDNVGLSLYCDTTGKLIETEMDGLKQLEKQIEKLK